MKEFNLSGIKCPHCGLLNELPGATAPRDFNMKIIPVKCFVGGDIQKGCMKEFNIVMKVQVFSGKTQQQVEEEVKQKSPQNPYDKQASI